MRIVIAIALALSCGACATVTRGTTEQIQITSEPGRRRADLTGAFLRQSLHDPGRTQGRVHCHGGQAGLPVAGHSGDNKGVRRGRGGLRRQCDPRRRDRHGRRCRDRGGAGACAQSGLCGPRAGAGEPTRAQDEAGKIGTAVGRAGATGQLSGARYRAAIARRRRGRRREGRVDCSPAATSGLKRRRRRHQALGRRQSRLCRKGASSAGVGVGRCGNGPKIVCRRS